MGVGPGRLLFQRSEQARFRIPDAKPVRDGRPRRLLVRSRSPARLSNDRRVREKLWWQGHSRVGAYRHSAWEPLRPAVGSAHRLLVILKPWSLRAASTTCTKSARFARPISERVPRSQRCRTTSSSLTQRTEKLADLPCQKHGLLQSGE